MSLRLTFFVLLERFCMPQALHESPLAVKLKLTHYPEAQSMIRAVGARVAHAAAYAEFQFFERSTPFLDDASLPGAYGFFGTTQ